MQKWEILPEPAIETITALLSAASWCKTQEMEIVLAQVIKKFISPAIRIKDSTDETSK